MLQVPPVLLPSSGFSSFFFFLFFSFFSSWMRSSYGAADPFREGVEVKRRAGFGGSRGTRGNSRWHGIGVRWGVRSDLSM